MIIGIYYLNPIKMCLMDQLDNTGIAKKVNLLYKLLY